MYQFLQAYRKDHKKANPEATPSYDEIRANTGLSPNDVSAGYKELVAHNIITRERRGRRKVVLFTTA